MIPNMGEQETTAPNIPHHPLYTFAHMKGVCDTPLHLFAQNMDITISKQTTPSSAVHLRSHEGRMRYAPTPVRLIHGYNDLGTNIPINGLTPSRMCRDAPTLNWRIEKRRSTRGQNSAFSMMIPIALSED